MFSRTLLILSLICLISCTKEIIQQKLTVSVTPANGGTVSPPSNSYEKGSNVSLVATPTGEYLFKQWQGSITGTSNPTSITMDADKSVTGVFEKRQYPLTLTIEGSGTVKEEVIALATQALYPSGTTVRLTAVPLEGWSFIGWSGDQIIKSNPLDIKVEKAISLKATFEKLQYPLNLKIEGIGTVKEEIIAVNTQSQYPHGTTVRLTAKPGEGYIFQNWSGDLISKDNPVQVIIQKPMNVLAKFVLKPFTPQGYPLRGINLTTKIAQNQRFFPGQYITAPTAEKMGIQIGKFPDVITYMYWDPSKAYLDFNQDGRLDMFAFLTHFRNDGGNSAANFGDLPGKVFLINDVWGPKPIITQHECSTRFMPRLSTIDVDNDGQMEVLFTSEDDHQLINGAFGAPAQTKYAKISKEGVITYNSFGEKVSIHAQTFGDIDNDGDVDVFNWRFPMGPMNEKKLPGMPIIYLNDGMGNFSNADNYRLIKGLDQIVKDLGDGYRNYGAIAIELFDVDGDGNLDLLVGADHRIKSPSDRNYEHNKTRLYWGLGKGYFDFVNNFTDLPNDYIDNYNSPSNGGMEPLGFNFFDFDNDGDIDILSSITPDYGGYILQLHENKGNKKFVDVTKEKITGYLDRYPRSGAIPPGSFVNFYDIRFYDKDNDGDLDIVPSAVAMWGYFTSPLPTNLYWENQGGKFVRKQ